MPDGVEALIVNGGGFDGGDGASFTNCGEDVHVVGIMAPLIEGHLGCVVIRPDGSRYLLASSATRWRPPVPSFAEPLPAEEGGGQPHLTRAAQCGRVGGSGLSRTESRH